MKTKSLLCKFKQSNKATLALMAFLFISLISFKPATAQVTVDFSLEDGVEICQGLSLSLDVYPSGGSGVYVQYDWVDPQNVIIAEIGPSAFLNIATPGSYSVEVTVTDDEGTSGTGIFNFIVLPGPTEAVITANGPLNFCQGGSVTFSATTGAGFTYQWRRGASIIAGANNPSYTATLPGDYRVIITAPNGCSKTSNMLRVVVYANPTPAATNSGPICENTTVQFFASPDGYNAYSWSGPQGFTSNEQNPELADVPLNFAGDYTVTVTDSNNCTASATTTLVIDPNPEAPTTATVNRNDICADDTGDIILTAAGGSGDRLVWYAGSCGGTEVGIGTSITIPRPAATTTYYARWETDSDCNASSCASVEVRIRPLPQISFSNSHVSCFGGNDGASTANVSIGTAPFTYNWNTTPAQTTQTATNLIAGNYTVVVTDAFGCSNNAETTITEPELLTVSIGNVVNVTCFGQSNGSAQAQPIGGTPPYSYAWSNGQTGQTASNLAAGTYTVIVTDSKGCTATESITITQPAALTLAVTSFAQPSCFGNNNGSITVLANGGVGGYTYTWNTTPVQTGATASGLTAGSYTVTVTDTNGCSTDLTYNLGQPALLTASIIDSQDVDCFGDTTGSATVAGAGGTPPYTYAWSNGQTSATAINLGAGTYNVIITDTNGCTASASVTINQSSQLSVNFIATQNVSCFGGNNGSATAQGIGGTPGYTYVWSNGQTGATATNLAANTYTVTVTDAALCSAINTVTITEPPLLSAVVGNVVNVACFGESNGSAQAQPTGGTPPYSYAWSNGQTTQTASGLAAGAYSVIITDSNGCTVTANVTITQPAELIVAVTSSNQPSCFGNNNGSISVAATGGETPYSYSWSNGQTGATATNLIAGSYTVTVTDANGCTDNLTIDLGQPDLLTATITASTDVDCFGQNTGSATVQGNGGTPPYTYAWSNGQTSQTAINLGAGTYSVIITDANGCNASTNVTINQNNPLEITASITDATCNGIADGAIVISVSGGTGPGTYNYIWSNGVTTQNNTNITAGNYTVTVTDANGCFIAETFTVGEPESITATATITPVSCNGGSNGAISVSVAGGTTPYSYAWSSGATGSSISGLTSGNYQLTVTDTNGCIAIFDYFVAEPAPITYTATVTNILCAGEALGAITITNVQGGTPPYTYAWSNGSTSQSLSNITAGSYTLTITDTNGCTTVGTFLVTEPDNPLDVIINTVDVACWGEPEGSAFAIVTGGTPFPGGTYQYLWSNGATTDFIDNVVAGIYSVTVTDANGCTTVATAQISEPDSPLEANAGPSITICSAANEGFAVLGGTTLFPTGIGGTEPYTYQWTSVPADPSLAGQETLENPVVYPIQATTYTVEVTDMGGCVAQHSATITIHPTVVADAGGGDDNSITLCSGGSVTLGGTPLGTGNTGYYLENPSVPQSQFTYRWDRIAPTTGFIGNVPHPTVSPTVTSTYVVRVRDTQGDNCIAYDTITVVVIPALVVEAIADASVCNGNNTGVSFTLGATISGGTGNPANYEILWTANPYDPSLEGQENLLNPVVSPTVTTTYTISVTDSEGIACAASDDVVITVFPQIIADAGDDATICNPANGGSHIIGGSPSGSYEDGSAGTFTYTWTSTPAGFTSSEANPIVAPTQTTTYYLTVTDENGCEEFDEVTLTVLDELIADAGTDLDMCHPANGGEVQLNGSATGGSPGYTYLWEPAEGLSNPNIANPLASPASTTVYTLTVTDSFGCVDTDQMTVSVVDELTVEIIGDSQMCHPTDGGFVNLTANAAGGTGSFSYQWFADPAYDFVGQENSASILVNPSASTTFTVVVTDLGSLACETQASFDVNVLDPIQIVLDADEEICYPDNTTNPGTTITANVSGGSGDFSYLWSTGESTQSIFVDPATTTIYSVLVTDNVSGCSAEETITITVFNELFANAGADQTVCFMSPVQLTGNASGGAGSGYSYSWSPAAGLNNPNIQNPIYTSPTGLNEGDIVTFTLTVTDPNGCIATDEVTIEVLPEIILDPGEDREVCFGSEVMLGGDPTAQGGSGNYNYFWTIQPGGFQFSTSPNPIVTIDFTGTREYRLLVHDLEGNCFRSADVSLTVIDEPVAAITASDEEICEGGLVTLTASGGENYLWTANPPYDFQGNENNQVIQVILMETTTFFLEASNVCGTDVAQITIAVVPGPVVDLGEDIQACDGETVILDAGEFANAEYLWSDGSTGQTLAVTQSGVYSVTVTNLDNLCSSEGEVQVTFNPLPEALVGDDQIICLGEEVMIGVDESVMPIPANTYLWLSDPEDLSISDPTISNPTVSPNVTTTYTLIETYVETGCTNSNTVVVTVVGGSPNAGEDQEICAGESVVLGPEEPYPGNTYTWTSSNPDEVFENDVPNPLVTPTITTTYTLVEVYTEFGCSNTASVVITVLPSPLAETGPDLDICLGDMVTIGTQYTVPMPPNTYEWTSEPLDESISNPNVSNPTVSPTVTTTYTLTETFTLTGCTTVNTVVVTVNEYPEALVIDDTSVCEGDEIQLGAASALPGLTYSWSSIPAGFASTDANPTVIPGFYQLDANNQITFILRVSNGNCTAEAQVVITVIPAPVLNISDDLTFCNAEEAQNTAIGGDAISGYTYLWTGTDGFTSTDANPVVSPAGPTMYTVVVTDTQTGCTATGWVTINISDLRFEKLGNPQICEGETIAWLGDSIIVQFGATPYQYFWTDSDGNSVSNILNPIVEAPFAESYTLTVIDAAGCPISHTFVIEYFDTPKVTLLVNNNPVGSTYTAYEGQTLNFEAIPNGYDRYNFYLLDAVDVPEGSIDEEGLKQWGEPTQSGLSNRFIVNEIKHGQRVVVVVYDGRCNGVSDIITIYVNELPNAFTPDGDGINDIFGEGVILFIFNRWGQSVYAGFSGWDGTYNGRKVSPGTYYYLRYIVDENLEITTLKGSVTVILTEN